MTLGVLILVVMEDALGVEDSSLSVTSRTVLILVVMEDALGAPKNHKIVTMVW